MGLDHKAFICHAWNFNNHCSNCSASIFNWGPMKFFLSLRDRKTLYFQPNTNVCTGKIWLDCQDGTFIIISKEVFTFTFAIDEFKTAILGFSEDFFIVLIQKLLFPLEFHNCRKQSCFIIILFLFMFSENKTREEWEVSKPQPGAFARFSVSLFSFNSLSLWNNFLD